MAERVREAVLRLLRVPAEPEPPPGDPSTLRVFRASPAYFRYRLLGWGIGQAGTLIGLLVGTVMFGGLLSRFEHGLVGLAVGAGAVLAWAVFLAQLPLSLAALRLDYDMRWYMLSDRAVRIREGVLSVRERTMTFANIQQISVRQGPLQRLFGMADIEVRTAGGGSDGEQGAGDLHRGYFHGVDDAEAIRDVIRERVRRYRDAGLGDPADAVARSPASPAPAVASAAAAPAVPSSGPSTRPGGPVRGAGPAARELLREVRALRAALTG